MRAGLSTIVSQYLILAGTFFVLPLYLQLVLGKNALETGVKILPISVDDDARARCSARAWRRAPRRARVVQIGLGFLFVSIGCLMATISPSLSSVPFALSLAGFGVGIGLAISQLGNVVMSSVGESRSSEAGGVAGNRAEPRPVARHGADRRGAADRVDDRLSRACAGRSRDPARRCSSRW